MVVNILKKNAEGKLVLDLTCINATAPILPLFHIFKFISNTSTASNIPVQYRIYEQHVYMITPRINRVYIWSVYCIVCIYTV